MAETAWAQAVQEKSITDYTEKRSGRLEGEKVRRLEGEKVGRGNGVVTAHPTDS